MAAVWPVQGGRITSGFGLRSGVNLPAGASLNHQGIDIAIPVGSPVGSILEGKVVKVGENSIRGKFVEIAHAGGLVSEYGHLSRYGVNVGDYVYSGSVIASSGNTGASSGPHLDLKIKLNGTYIDPMKILKGASSPGAAAASMAVLPVMSTDGLVELIKSNWLLIIGGVLVFAVLSK